MGMYSTMVVMTPLRYANNMLSSTALGKGHHFLHVYVDAEPGSTTDCSGTNGNGVSHPGSPLTHCKDNTTGHLKGWNA